MVAMSDIGGLSMQKQLLRELVVYPLQNPSLKGEKKLYSSFKWLLSSLVPSSPFLPSPFSKESSFLMECFFMGPLVWASRYCLKLCRQRRPLTVSPSPPVILPGN